MLRVTDCSTCCDADQMLTNKNRPWTQQDDEKLLALAAAGRSTLSIAAAMKRSRDAVASRLSILRLRAKARKDDHDRTLKSPM